jgi:hypothetical protein
MGAHDNEEIIDLTDVVEEPVFSQSPSQKTGDFPPEQAIDPKDLEDEFEQLLQGPADSQKNGNGGSVDDDLDIESLFEEMDQSPDTADAATSLGLEDEKHEGKKPPVHSSEDAPIEDMSDIEDIFASMDDGTPDESSLDPDQEIEALFSEEPPSSEPEPDDFMVEEEPFKPARESEPSPAEDLGASEDLESMSSYETTEEEKTLTLDEESREASSPEMQPQEPQDAGDTQTDLQVAASSDADEGEAAVQETTSLDEEAFQATAQEAAPHKEDGTETPLPETESLSEDATQATLQETEPLNDPLESAAQPSAETIPEAAGEGALSSPVDQPLVEELLERIAALEARWQQPDQETMFAMLSTFFQDNESGASVLDELTEKVTTRVQETAKHLVEEKLDALDVPSSEEIAAMVKEEISASVAENMPAAPDTQAIVQEIREDLQKKVQEGMDAWETDRIALRTDIDALQKDQLDKQALINEIREDLQEKVQEGMTTWEADRIALRTDIDALQKDHLDKQELVREIREDLRQRVQEGMEAWEAQRLNLKRDIEQLQTAEAERPDIQAVIEERTRDLEQKMQENQATWEAQLPALRTDIDALQEEQLDKQALIDAIREDLQEKVQEGMDAWEADRIALRTDIDALQKDRLDKQELVQEIREDLKQRVQKDMDAWEAQRIFLNQEITELKETMTEASSGKQARIDELAAAMISKHDLDAIKEELLTTISREIPGAAARVIREEIAALMK